jgi:predicted MFS family arabinose efflux permease
MSRLGLLREPDFRRLFAAPPRASSVTGSSSWRCRWWRSWCSTAGEFQVGLLSAATMAGSLLVGLPAGAWVDRWRKRTVLITTDLLRAAVIVVVPLAWWAGLLDLRVLFAVALAHGVLTVFFDVAYVSYLPHLVGRDNLTEGNAKLAAVRSAVSVGGPGLAGPLVGLAGAPVALVASGAGMLLSSLFVLRIHEREPRPDGPEHRHLGREIKEGLAFVFRHPLLRAIVAADGLFGLFLVAFQTMLLVFLAREVGLGSFGIGAVLSTMGCGGLTGALLARRVTGRFGAGRVIWLAPLLTCPPALLMPLAGPGWTVVPATAGLAVLSMGGVIRLIAQAGIQQSVTPDRVLGRMSATFRFVTWSAMPLGGLLGGALGTWLGAPATLAIGAVGMTLTFVPAFFSGLRSGAEGLVPTR